MDETSSNYQVVLLRHHINDVVKENLSQIRAAFAALDSIASRADGEDDILMEVVNSVSDLFRGSLVKLFGVDVRPVSELGPFEEVDLEHTQNVFARLVGVARPTLSSMTGNEGDNDASHRNGHWSESNRQRLFDQVTQLELELRAYRELIKDQLPPDANAAFTGLEHQVRLLRSGTNGAIDGEHNRKSSGVA